MNSPNSHLDFQNQWSNNVLHAINTNQSGFVLNANRHHNQATSTKPLFFFLDNEITTSVTFATSKRLPNRMAQKPAAE